MNSAPDRERAAHTRAARRSGVRLSVHQADVRHARADDRLRATRDRSHTALRHYGHGSPHQLAAADELLSATADYDIAAVHAYFDRTSGDRGALLALAVRVDAYARMIAHPATDRFAALARRIAATLRDLAAALRALAAESTVTPVADSSGHTTDRDPGPPPPVDLFVYDLTRAPGAPSLPALSAR